MCTRRNRFVLICSICVRTRICLYSRLDRTGNTISEVSVKNEFNSLLDKYEPCIEIVSKDEQRRICLLLCTCSLDGIRPFHIYLSLSRHYPIISQLFVQFKMSTNNHGEHFKILQSRIQFMFDQTSQYYFYHGQLCLHRCLIKLKCLLESYDKQEKKRLSSIISSNIVNKSYEYARTNSEFDSTNLFNTTMESHNSMMTSNTHRILTGSSSSTRTSDSQMSGVSFAQGHRRTCGARFSGATHLICFGRITNCQSVNAMTAVTGINDTVMNRPQSLPMRSSSLISTKSRENSNADEHVAYRPTSTNTVQIQHASLNQRLPTCSAPVRSLLGTSIANDYARTPTNYRRPPGQLIHPQSIVSIYDMSILLPVSRKLADDYQIDLKNVVDMCEKHQELTGNMAKDDLAHCWHLLEGLLSIQTQLQADDSWFQTPIAHGRFQYH
jgi:hypothetical protein